MIARDTGVRIVVAPRPPGRSYRRSMNQSVSLSARSRETNRLAKTWGISVPVCEKLTINGASLRFTSIAGSSTQLGIVPPDAPVQRIEAEPIHKLGWHLDVPDCQVTIFSRLKRADLSRSAKGPGRSPGDAGDA